MPPDPVSLAQAIDAGENKVAVDVDAPVPDRKRKKMEKKGDAAAGSAAAMPGDVSSFVILSPPKDDKGGEDMSAKHVVKLTGALASPYLKHIKIQQGKVVRVTRQAHLVVAVFKQFFDDFDRSYRIAFKRLVRLAKHPLYRMSDIIQPQALIALGTEKGLFRFRVLLDKPEKQDLSTGALSPFGYKDITSWPGEFELGYEINPETGEGRLFTTPAYQWVRPLHSYPKDDGLVSKDMLVYEIKKDTLQWKYLLNRLHQGDMAKPLAEILKIAQDRIADVVDGDVNDEIFAEIFVTATRKGSDYTVTFTFPRRALSRKDVKGVFPKDSPHGYDGTPLAIISRIKPCFLISPVSKIGSRFGLKRR